jgi:hypothetical protein
LLKVLLLLLLLLLLLCGGFAHAPLVGGKSRILRLGVPALRKFYDDQSE